MPFQWFGLRSHEKLKLEQILFLGLRKSNKGRKEGMKDMNQWMNEGSKGGRERRSDKTSESLKHQIHEAAQFPG